MTTIRALNPHVTIFSAPFNRFGLFKVGARSTAIKLDNNDVVIVSAITAEKKVQDTIASIGRVAYLVAPDVEHHLQLEAYAKLYPEAKLVGVEGVQEKHPDLKFHKIFGDAKYDNVEVGWESSGIETCYFPGHINKELAILHKPTKTLVEADLLFNLPGYEQYEGSSSSAGIAGMMSPFALLSADGAAHKKFNWYMAAKDKKSFKAGLDTLKTWDFQTIVPCHGEVIEQNAKQIWDSAFELFYASGKGADL